MTVTILAPIAWCDAGVSRVLQVGEVVSLPDVVAQAWQRRGWAGVSVSDTPAVREVARAVPMETGRRRRRA